MNQGGNEGARSERSASQVEKLRALGQMTAEVAHDFNNILTIVLAHAQFALQQVGDDPTLRRDLKAIERAARDGIEVIRRLSEFTRIRPKETARQRTDINQAVREALEATRHRWEDDFKRKGLDLEVVTELGELPPVNVNPVEIREVLTNLVFNALEAMPQGGMLKMKTQMGDSQVLIFVSDTGTGIPREIRERIFDPFFTTKGPARSGLGLSVSSAIIGHYGGEILVQSRVGEGSTFTIELPTISISEEELPPHVREPASILIIDDEVGVLEVLSQILTMDGHWVTLASSGEEGLIAFQDGQFDLVLTDLGMPGMSGWDVSKAIKELKPQVPIIILTGWALDTDEETMRERYIDGIVAKPFEMSAILQVVHDALKQ